jgi:hypothetical protein
MIFFWLNFMSVGRFTILHHLKTLLSENVTILQYKAESKMSANQEVEQKIFEKKFEKTCQKISQKKKIFSLPQICEVTMIIG